MQNGLAHISRQLGPRGVQVEVKITRQADEQFLVVVVEALSLGRPGHNDSLGNREAVVAEQQLVVDGHSRAQSRALRAGAEWGVERERAWLDLGERERVLVGTGELFGKHLPGFVPLQVDKVDCDQAVGQPQRGLQGISEAPEHVIRGHEPVNHDRNVVLQLLFQCRRLGELDKFTIDERS